MTAPLAVTADLWHAIDRLLNPTRTRLTRDDGQRLQITLPSLLDQLIEAIETGGENTSNHGVQKSKPPCDVIALSLLIEIAEAARTGCWNWHLKRTYKIPYDLRQVASAVIRHGDPELIDTTAHTVRSWASRIKTTISSDPDRTWRMFGGTCRVCSSTTVPAFDDDGNETRQPALIVHSEDGVIDRIECDFCGSKLTGHDLTAIVVATLTPTRG
jgi:hypothetical protein